MPETLPFPEVVDSTMLGEYLACEHKYWWANIRRLRSATPSIHLHFGACFAAGLDAARRAFYGDAADGDAALAIGFRRICLEWGAEELDAFPPKTFFSCVLLLDYYLEIHPLATDPIQPYIRVDGQPACEFTFALPTQVLHPETGQPILYAGRFDMLGLYNDQLFVVDEKTTAQLGPTWLKQWDLRGQFLGYCFAAQQYGHPVVGAVVRGLKVSTTGFDHAEPIIYAPEWLLREWNLHLEHTLRRMISSWKANYWDKNLDNSCTHYGGCQYRTLCTTPTPERWIDGYYIPNTWNPLHKGD